MRKIAFVSSPEYREHRNADYHSAPSHPESPERVRVIDEFLAADGLLDDLLVREPVEATIEQLAAVHDAGYIADLERLCASGPLMLDEDTGAGPESWRVSRLAAGAACLAVDDVMTGRADAAFCSVRPPGHHAECARAMGFCLFNNVAVAAEHARRAHGLERVAILDWDVHHGNGTQHTFESDPGIFYLSIHQYPHYPGTGAASERGRGEGEGATLNAPMAAGTGDREWLAAIEGDFTRAIDAFAPQLILVSAGFDAHAADPLSGTLVTDAGYTRMTDIVRDWAAWHAQGRVVSLLEGGYNLGQLPRSVAAHITALLA